MNLWFQLLPYGNQTSKFNVLLKESPYCREACTRHNLAALVPPAPVMFNVPLGTSVVFDMVTWSPNVAAVRPVQGEAGVARTWPVNIDEEAATMIG